MGDFKDLTKTDLANAVLDLKSLIREAAREGGPGTVTKIKALIARKADFAAELESRG